MSESFLGRWSRRKAEAKRGEEPPPKSDTGVPVAKPEGTEGLEWLMDIIAGVVGGGATN